MRSLTCLDLLFGPRWTTVWWWWWWKGRGVEGHGKIVMKSYVRVVDVLEVSCACVCVCGSGSRSSKAVSWLRRGRWWNVLPCRRTVWGSHRTSRHLLRTVWSNRHRTVSSKDILCRYLQIFTFHSTRRSCLGFWLPISQLFLQWGQGATNIWQCLRNFHFTKNIVRHLNLAIWKSGS